MHEFLHVLFLLPYTSTTKMTTSIAQNIEALGAPLEEYLPFYNFRFFSYEENAPGGKNKVKTLIYKGGNQIQSARQDIWFRSHVTDSTTLFCDFAKPDSEQRIEVRNQIPSNLG